MADSASIRVPYQNLKQAAEVELVAIHDGDRRDARVSNGGDAPSRSRNTSLLTLILSCMIAAGVQFGWALQLSLLTPYVQTLGIGHAFSSFIWLCGPITGLVVQPCVGIWSDKCTSKYGRRRPFILAGSLMISVATLDIC